MLMCALERPQPAVQVHLLDPGSAASVGQPGGSGGGALWWPMAGAGSAASLRPNSVHATTSTIR